MEVERTSPKGGKSRAERGKLLSGDALQHGHPRFISSLCIDFAAVASRGGTGVSEAGGPDGWWSSGGTARMHELALVSCFWGFLCLLRFSETWRTPSFGWSTSCGMNPTAPDGIHQVYITLEQFKANDLAANVNGRTVRWGIRVTNLTARALARGFSAEVRALAVGLPCGLLSCTSRHWACVLGADDLTDPRFPFRSALPDGGRHWVMNVGCGSAGALPSPLINWADLRQHGGHAKCDRKKWKAFRLLLARVFQCLLVGASLLWRRHDFSAYNDSPAGGVLGSDLICRFALGHAPWALIRRAGRRSSEQRGTASLGDIGFKPA